MSEDQVDQELLMRYLDGELSAAEREGVEAALERSTELQRDLMLYRRLREDMGGLAFEARGGPSVWSQVRRRLTRPIGWFLILAGSTAWTGHLLYLFLAAHEPTWEKLATSAIGIGILVLFASVIHDRYLEYLTDPYRDVER